MRYIPSVKAYRYHGIIYLKIGPRKSDRGVLYSHQDLATGRRPAVELWRDGTITHYDRPEGTVDELTFVSKPEWAYQYEIRRFKPRS